MKFLITLLLCISYIAAKSQSTDSLFTYEKDKFTGKEKIFNKESTDLINPSDVKCRITVAKLDKIPLIAFNISNGDFGCTDENSKIYFLATDGSTIIARNNRDFDCSGQTIIYLISGFFNGKVGNFLKAKLLQSVRVESRTTSFDFEIEVPKANNLKNLITFILK